MLKLKDNSVLNAPKNGVSSVDQSKPCNFRCSVRNIDVADRVGSFFQKRTFSGALRNVMPLRELIYDALTVKNWVSVWMATYGLKKSVDAIFRSGKIFQGMNAEKYNEFESRRYMEYLGVPVELVGNTARFEFRGREITLEYGKTGVSGIREVFFSEIYQELDCKGRQVLDIGANIGDTAIYFAMQGASKVIAIEPYPYTFKIAKGNVDSAGMGGAVKMINAAIASQSGETCIDDGFENNGSSDLREFGVGRKVPLYSLKELVDAHGLSDAALKVDCEGGEYCAIIGSSKETLRSFSEMAIEYHYGYKNLEKKLLDAGFSVHVQKPNYYYNAYATQPHYMIGMLHAKRIG